MKDKTQTMQSIAIHERSWQLLPWFVNGTLPAEQVTLVEQHVTTCAECTSEVRAHRALQAQLREGDAIVMAPQSAWQKMAARLDDEDEALTARYAARAVKPARHAHTTRHEVVVATPWTWAVAAQALIIMGLASALWWQTRTPDEASLQASAWAQPQYQTLTSAAEPPSGPGVVRVVFRRDLALVEVNALLRALSTQIVAGPTEAGVFTLAAPTVLANLGGVEKNSMEPLLTHLRADARVIFAEPAALSMRPVSAQQSEHP